MPLQVLTILCLKIYFLYLSGVYCGFFVNYERSNICGLKGASAVLPCRFEYYGIGFYLGGEWYEEHRKRVARKYTNYYPDCSLYIDELSHAQSGIYHFRFRTSLRKNGIRGTPGVTLSVTDLRVKEEAVVENQNQTKLTCSTSCSLGSHLQYVWYKNGQQLQDKTTASFILDSTRPSEEGSYSCTVRGYEAHCSPSVCAPEKQCWGVTYSSTNVCALLGSSVDIPCAYKYLEDHKVKSMFWFNKQKSCNHPEDLRLDEDYANHVEYLGNKENNCTLKLKDIRESHSGEYAFRFTTEQGESYSGLPGVTITVTTLQVTPPPKSVSEGKSVTLTCNTTCTLSDVPIFMWYSNGTSKHTNIDNKLHLNPVSSEDAGSYSCAVRGHESLSSTSVILDVRFLQVYITSEMVTEGERVTLTCNSIRDLSNNSTFIWYKNGQPVTYKHTTRENKLHLNPVSSEDAGSYSCAVSRHGSLPSTAVFLSVRYKPKDISVSLSPSEGSFVTLSCSSDANPPVHTYTWYMKSGAESLVRGTGENISFNVTSDTSGLYYCEAQNEVGSQKSVDVSVPKEDVIFHTTTSDGCASGLIVAIILVGFLLFAIIPICMYRIACTRRTTQTKKQEAHSDVCDDTYTGLNLRNKSPEYDTLQNVLSLSDTYMPLQRREQESEYETLQRREQESEYETLQRREQESEYETLQRREQESEYETLQRREQESEYETLQRREQESEYETLQRREQESEYETLQRREQESEYETLQRREMPQT